ncbi:protein-disulfide reductase DsbD family protein [Algoriphagus halophytocola]|uniref:Thioredoxin family protein n=1 Tax=Algoriphagus halophytocola TaxID=2991499 RepID=A0ABY6MDZ7_9BACT|nr:cytochrome c biogenesis protein CcdA [Algoriphagus sp. TR-M5]UZD21134.1 thioredoxin family protein [Algoriphagus sp. TR-M5]
MKKIQLLLLMLFTALISEAQILEPVSWKVESHAKKNGLVELIITADIDSGWHLYSQHIEEGGPEPTRFSFTESSDYQLEGEVQEMTEPTEKYDDMFLMDVSYFSDKSVFKQIIKANKEKGTVLGVVNFMVCDDNQCLPPNEVELSIPFEATLPVKKEEKRVTEPEVKKEVEEKPKSQVITPAPEMINESDQKGLAVEEKSEEVEIVESKSEALPKSSLAEQDEVQLPIEETEQNDASSIWGIFIAGFLGGFAALLMPCIFPMLPLTVSYFTKQSASKASGISKAAFYGLSIIFIYVGLGMIITIIFGADALNALSTNGIFNFLFFLLLVVFAASFFGAFELTLPHSWSNKLDSKSDKGGLLGLFFMAATLSLVSFSCTGPIIGTLLVQAASTGAYLGPAMGMLGFSIALAIPFTLFAIFPSWMQSLPKSGGWLNSVKVVLGFLELALAMKFLSNVDLAYHWDIFDREVFLTIWIVIFGLMGLYLLGKIKFAHDSELKYLSTPRVFLSVIVISFTIYMIPGLWGAPLKAISAFLPPQHTQDFDLYTASLGGGFSSQEKHEKVDRKYSDLFHAPLNLEPFYDFDEGMAYANEIGKPVLIDFTGHACVNCRKMEASIWSDPKVLETLKNDYVLIQLYVDDKTELPESEWKVSEYSGKMIKTIGKKWSDFQAANFNSNSQPFYVVLGEEEQPLIKPVGAVYDVDKYHQYLLEGVKVFRQ